MERLHEMEWYSGRHGGLIDPSHQKAVGGPGGFFIPCGPRHCLYANKKLKTFFHFYETLDADHLTLPKPQTPYALGPTDAAVAQQSQNASGSHDFRKGRA